ncbi:MAG: hypothetical protein IIX14_05220 [Clostridia bacterium]|jgi:hypothetical protein|nr:hypothetical protein [Clostridia bacterium]
MNNGKKGNIDVNELFKKINKSTDSPTSQGDVNDFIDENLSEAQAKAVRELLADEEKTKAILNSDAAKSLFKKFFGGQGNG